MAVLPGLFAAREDARRLPAEQADLTPFNPQDAPLPQPDDADIRFYFGASLSSRRRELRRSLAAALSSPDFFTRAASGGEAE